MYVQKSPMINSKFQLGKWSLEYANDVYILNQGMGYDFTILN